MAALLALACLSLPLTGASRECRSPRLRPPLLAAASPPPLPSEQTTTHARALFLTYATAGGAMVLGARSLRPLPLAILRCCLCSLWTGCLLGVSFMEAWVKFKAPLLSKHVGFDVGRHVFRGLNAIEAALAATLLALAALPAARFPPSSLSPLPPLQSFSSLCAPTLLAATLGLQIFWLTPQLELAAFHKISAALEQPDRREGGNAALSAELRAKTKGKEPPARWLHVAYVLLEAGKVAGLLAYALALCSSHLSLVHP